MGNYEGNQAPDHLNFSVLHGDSSILSSFEYRPAAWTGTAVNSFTHASFAYVGDCSGKVGFTVAAVTGEDGHVGGALDNLSVSQTLPEPGAWELMILGLGFVGSAARRRRKMLAA